MLDAVSLLNSCFFEVLEGYSYSAKIGNFLFEKKKIFLFTVKTGI